MEVLDKKQILIESSILDKMNLCRNCKSASSCSLKSDERFLVTYCEEHIIDSEQTLIKKSPEQNIPPQTFKSLCQTCEHCSNCSLKNNRTIILECEQYE